MMEESLKEFLKKASIFSNLNDKELDLLAKNAHEKAYPKNSYIIRKGEVGTSIFLMRSGKVNVILEKETGNKVHLSTLERGNFFGEMSMFDVRPRSATVVAEEDTTIIEICREDFLQEIAKSSEISLKVLTEMTSRFRHTDEIVKQLDDKVHWLYDKDIHQLKEGYRTLEGLKEENRILEEIIRNQQEYAKTMKKLYDKDIHQLKEGYRTLEEIIRNQQEYAKTMSKLLSNINSEETR